MSEDELIALKDKFTYMIPNAKSTQTPKDMIDRIQTELDRRKIERENKNLLFQTKNISFQKWILGATVILVIIIVAPYLIRLFFFHFDYNQELFPATKLTLYFIFWIIGFTVSLYFGHLLTGRFLNWLRSNIDREIIGDKKTDLKEKEALLRIKSNTLYIHRSLIGLCERSFFTVLVAFNISGYPTAMLIWITIKMLYNWGILVQGKTRTHRSYVLSALLLGNLSSMFFAIIGGLICRIPSLF